MTSRSVDFAQKPQIAESGLPLFAFDDFEEAAVKVINLARAKPATDP